MKIRLPKTEFGFECSPYRKVYAVITTANEGSVAFHRAVGYRHIATMPNCGYKFGKWYGTVWMEKDLNVWDVPLGEPTSIQCVPKPDGE